MVEEIYQLKNELLEEMAREVKERGIDRLDKERVDMVKDLAEAEKACWEAEYYRAVAEAMEAGAGYDMGGMGYNGMPGAQSGNRSGGSGGSSRGGSQGGSNRGGSGYRDSRGRYARRGYGAGYQEHVDALRMELQSADPQQREQIMSQLRNLGM